MAKSNFAAVTREQALAALSDADENNPIAHEIARLTKTYGLRAIGGQTALRVTTEIELVAAQLVAETVDGVRAEIAFDRAAAGKKAGTA
jgi:hypothetical protein